MHHRLIAGGVQLEHHAGVVRAATAGGAVEIAVGVA
jgi:hypothetical protein